MDRSLILYLYTIRHLRLKQIIYRFIHFINRYASTKPKAPGNLPARSSLNWKEVPFASTTFPTETKFVFLNKEYSFDKEVDWDFMGFGKLWAYNLNYFDFLNSPGLNLDQAIALMKHYVNKQDTLSIGLEPYPISIRGINWIKFLARFNIRDFEIETCLFRHYLMLSRNLEYHLMGNHLLENGFSLLFGAIYFKNEKHYKTAKRILVRQLDEQILRDGAHFELSPMYHQLMLFRVLDSINLIQNNPWKNDTLLPLLHEKASKMLSWISKMTFCNGDIPLVNDAAFQIAPTTSELLEYAAHLKTKKANLPLLESGYRKYVGENYECIVDAGKIGPDYIPGHAHSDIFNFLVYCNGQAFIVDTGTSTYDSGIRRQHERSTKAHNTVSIDDHEQNEMWASFRVARRTYPKIHYESDSVLEASVNFATGKAEHRRRFLFNIKKVTIEDEIIIGQHATAYVHLHPTVKIFEAKKDKIITNKGTLFFSGHLALTLNSYCFAPEFNKLIESTRIEAKFDHVLHTEIIF